ncbi:molybdopterin-containing oxidoreductase family protein [Gordonibacter sp.]|uniref:molybdopterin-containing oxidoreductase family protein n=1 Tax=Gordonibacter sp. TaxID=1968902 RepID=UPI002FCC83C3
MSEESFVYTACPGWGDHEYCALKTIVKDGKIIRTEPAEYTGAEQNEGFICQKGVCSWRQVYNKERLTVPLKRIGERGEGKWEEISWDQAFDEIAEKLIEIRDTYGPEALAMWYVPASLPPSYGLEAVLMTRFSGLFGATHPLEGWGLDNGPFYAAYYDMGNTYRYMSSDPSNWDHSDLIIVWGANPIENQHRMGKHIVEAKSNGARIVDIGLLFDGTAGYSDEFVPVKPGSDPALSLCMANHIVSKGLYEKEYLLEHTVAPFMVRDDTDEFMRDGDGNYLAMDKVHGLVAAMPGVKEIAGAADLEIEGSFEVFGVPCKTAFTRLREHLSFYTPEYQERITGVPAQTAVRLAEEYAAAERPYILGALGLRYQNQGESYRSFYLLGMLMGNLGKPGAGVTSELGTGGWPFLFNDGPIVCPEGPERFKGKILRQPDFWEQVQTEQPYPIKALMIPSGNPVHNCPSRGRWLDEVFPKLDLIVDIDIWMTDTGEYADYILPDCQPFERTELICIAAYNHVVLTEPAVEPVGGLDPATRYYELAKRLGFGEYFEKSAEEWCDIRLQSDSPMITAIDPPLTMERLKEEKLVRIATPPIPWDPFLGMDFGTPSGRLEFYCEKLVPAQAQIARYIEPYEVPTETSKAQGENEEFPYQFFSGRQRFFMQSMFTDDPVMRELSGGKPSARINPVDAAREGIVDGDKVEVYNGRGHVVAIMRLDEVIPPGTIQVWFGWRSKHFEEGMYSELLVPMSSRETMNDVADLWWKHMEEEDRVKWHFFLGSEATMAGAWDTIWDCACNIRKVTDAADVDEDGKDVR